MLVHPYILKCLINSASHLFAVCCMCLCFSESHPCLTFLDTNKRFHRVFPFTCYSRAYQMHVITTNIPVPLSGCCLSEYEYD